MLCNSGSGYERLYTTKDKKNVCNLSEKRMENGAEKTGSHKPWEEYLSGVKKVMKAISGEYTPDEEWRKSIKAEYTMEEVIII